MKKLAVLMVVAVFFGFCNLSFSGGPGLDFKELEGKVWKCTFQAGQGGFTTTRLEIKEIREGRVKALWKVDNPKGEVSIDAPLLGSSSFSFNFIGFSGSELNCSLESDGRMKVGPGPTSRGREINYMDSYGSI